VSEASNNAAAAPPTTADPAWRLLPVLAMALLVGLMIRGGIARNEQRHRMLVDDLDRSRATMGGFVADGARFLAGQQSADGSWEYFRSPSPSLTPAESHPRVASTARILLGLRGTGQERHPFYGKGLEYVRKAADGRVEPTLEALSLGLLLLGPGVDSPEQVRALLDEQPTVRGLYPRRLGTPASAATGSRVALSDNILLVAVLPALQMEPAPLATAVRRRLEVGGPEPSPSWTVLRYLASAAAESATPAGRSALGRLVARVPGPGLPDARSDSLALGAHVRVRAEQCLREGDPCTDLNGAVGALVRRRRPDGSWAAAPFASDGGYSVGSAAETTSFALSGLAAFARILEGRAEGRLMSGEEDESRPRNRPASAAPSLRK